MITADATDREFTRRVLSVVRSIPAGRVSTYGDVAAYAGRPRAARAVGNIMRECRDASVPCHRVIAAGGRLGGYGGRESLKRQLLAVEGCQVVGHRVRDFTARRWAPAATRVRGRHPRGRGIRLQPD